MTIDKESILSICEEVRVHAADYGHGLELLFVLHHDKDRADALCAEETHIKKHSNGDNLWKLLQESEQNNHSTCPGLVYSRTPGIFGFGARTKLCAPIFLNIDEAQSLTEIHHMIYHFLWHALELSQQVLSGKQDTHTPFYEQHRGATILHSQGSFENARNNLRADIFSSILTEMRMDTGFIEHLARQRSRWVLEKTSGLLCENYPYPLVAEACRFIFTDLRGAKKEPKESLPFALKMATEITETYGQEALKQWKEFCLPAQHMIWIDCDKARTIGHATFTSENPYIRAAGYLLCEHLGNEHPDPPMKWPDYNAFASDSDNESLHQKLCERALQTALYTMATDDEVSTTIFRDMATEQNRKLLRGNPSGWCGYALLETAKFCEQKSSVEFSIEDLPDIFRKAVGQIQWGTLLEVSKAAIHLRRQGKPVSISAATYALPKMNGLEEIVTTLGGSIKSDFENAQKIPSNIEYMQDRIDSASFDTFESAAPVQSDADLSTPDQSDHTSR